MLRANSRFDLMPPCASIIRSDNPARCSRATTTSMAARFSATNSARLPWAMRAAIRLAMVCDFPVPGGPQITRDSPASTRLIARCWLASASTTRNSDSGGSMSGWLGEGSLILAARAARASATPATAATKSLAAKASRLLSRSATIGILVYMKLPTTIRFVMARPGTLSHRLPRRSSAPCNPGNEVGKSSARSSAASDWSMPCSVRNMWASIGLTWGSPVISMLKSHRPASSGFMARGTSMTGALGGEPAGAVQVDSPMATNKVLRPFSSRCSCVRRCNADSRLRASARASSPGKSPVIRTALPASKFARTGIQIPDAPSGVKSSVPTLRSL